MTPIPTQDRNQLPRPKILILGHGRHGKDTVAEFMCAQYGLTFRSSSEFCAEHVVWPAMKQANAQSIWDKQYNAEPMLIYPEYPTWQECYADRMNHRAFWHQAIAEYNQPDPTRLATELLATGVDIYVGMRSNTEFQACMEAELFDHVFWVCSLGRGIPEEDSSSFNIEFDPETMFIIENNGDLEDLKEEIGIYSADLSERKEYMRLTDRRLAAIKNMIECIEDEGSGCGGIADLKAFLGNLEQYPRYWDLIPK